MQNIVVLGAGGFAREARDWAEQTGSFRVSAFFDEFPKAQELDGLEILSDWNQLKKFDSYVLGVGDPLLKEKFMNLAAAQGRKAATVVHPTVVIGRKVEIGEGSVVCPMTVLTTNIIIGRAVMLNLTVTVGHDCRIGDYVTVSPGANISGGCHIGANTYIGTNATLREYVNFPANSTLGMGGSLVKTAETPGIYVGNPAKLKA